MTDAIEPRMARASCHRVKCYVRTKIWQFLFSVLGREPTMLTANFCQGLLVYNLCLLWAVRGLPCFAVWHTSQLFMVLLTSGVMPGQYHHSISSDSYGVIMSVEPLQFSVSKFHPFTGQATVVPFNLVQGGQWVTATGLLRCQLRKCDGYSLY